MTAAGESMTEGGTSEDIAAVAEVLSDTPFHRWSQLRAFGDDERRGVFDAATAQVRAGWSTDDHHAEVRKALTVAATEIILALPDWATGDQVLVEHLRCAGAALQAAVELSPGLSARSMT